MAQHKSPGQRLGTLSTCTGFIGTDRGMGVWDLVLCTMNTAVSSTSQGLSCAPTALTQGSIGCGCIPGLLSARAF